MTGARSRWYVDQVREQASHRCKHCHRPLVWVDDVGWVGSVPGDSYDICDGDPFGNHVAGPLDADDAGGVSFR